MAFRNSVSTREMWNNHVDTNDAFGCQHQRVSTLSNCRQRANRSEARAIHSGPLGGACVVVRCGSGFPTPARSISNKGAVNEAYEVRRSRADIHREESVVPSVWEGKRSRAPAGAAVWPVSVLHRGIYRRAANRGSVKGKQGPDRGPSSCLHSILALTPEPEPATSCRGSTKHLITNLV